MNLLVDIGNTNLRWACADVHAPGPVRTVRHSGGMPLDLLAAWETLERPARLLVSNVGGGAVAKALERVARSYWGLSPEFAATRSNFLGVRIAYSDPARLGVDRWLTLIAAHARAHRGTLIVDAGTAATFDLLLSDGRHLGGLILPGIEMMRESLLAGTNIPRVETEPARDPWASDTGAAVAAGSLHAIAALTGNLAGRLAEQTGQPPSLLLTGGDADRVAAVLDRTCELAPDLVLRGLALVSENDG